MSESGPQATASNAPDNRETTGEAAANANPPLPPPPPPQYEYDESGFPLPSYHVAAELPTYEEAERTKGGKFPDDNGIPVRASAIDEATFSDLGLTLVTLDPDDIEGGSSSSSSSASDLHDLNLLGNDFVFFTAFLTAFLFNWIGFLLLMCFCHTIAARYGALSGFGLSLTKWTLIVKRTTEFSNVNATSLNMDGESKPHGFEMGHGTSGSGHRSLADDAGNSVLWWLIMAFGLLICIRSIVQYLHIKRRWASLSTTARERLFFFY